MRRVFVSYASVDRSLVAALVHDLESAGYDVWFDQELSGGQPWWDVILQQVHASDAVLFAVTEDSISSHACRSETDYAIALRKTVIPIRLTDLAPEEAPSVLQRLQWIDFREPDHATTLALVRALNNAASEPLPDPLPEAPTVPLSYLSELVDKVESPGALTSADQAWVAFTLRQYWKEGRDRAQVSELAEQFLRRGDLLAAVAADLEGLFEQPDEPSPAAREQVTPAPARALPDEPIVVATRASGRRKWWKAIVAAAFLVVTLATVLVVLLLSNGGDDAAPAIVVVPGTQPWTDTGLVLHSDDSVTVSAEGSVEHAAGNATTAVGPDGSTDPDLDVFNVIDGHHAALIGRIGDGDPFVVGANSTFVVHAPEGVFHLGINDRDVSNNSGQFTARVTVTRSGDAS